MSTPENEIIRLREENDRLKNELFNAKEQNSYLMDKSPIGIILAEKGKIIYCNEAFLKQIGYQDKNEILNRPVFDFIADEYKDIARQRMQSLYANGNEAVSMEEKFVKKNGNFITVIVLGRLVYIDEKPLVLGYISDITEIKNAADTNLVFKTFFESAPDSILFLNAEGIIQKVNQQFIKELKHPDEKDIPGKHISYYFSGIDWPETISAIKNRRTIEKQCQLKLHPTNEIKNQWLKLVQISDEKPLYIAFNRNIDNAIQHQQKIEEQNARLEELNKRISYSEKNYKRIFDSVNEGILLIDVDSRKIMEANQSFQKLFLYTESEILGRQLEEFFIEDTENESDNSIKMGRLFRKIGAQSYLAIGQRKNGEKFWTNLLLKYIEISNKTSLIVLIHDIDLLRKSQQELQVSQTNFKELSELSQTGIFMFNPSGFLYANPATLNITGYQYEELQKLKPGDLFHPSTKQWFNEEQFWVSKEKKIHLQIMLVGKNGTDKWVIFSATKIQTSNELYAIGNFQDISSTKKYEEDLIFARKKAEESDELKSAFLANVSHEIRTPMNGILGFIQLLKENKNPEKIARYLQIIESSANQLLRIINDILDISKIEAGQTKIKIKKLELNALFKNLHDLFAVQLPDKKIMLIFENVNEPEVFVNSDEKILIQVLTNLLGNAIKFTREGSITFGYRLENKIIHIYVSDTGLGIPKNKKELVFTRFAQIHSEILTTARGTGLGLPITKKLVELLDGKIWFESEENKGTHFFIELPDIQ